MESIHKRIRRLREAKKKTQQQLADAVEVTYQSVQEWEREGGTAPSRKRQKAVADFLGVTVHELVTGEPAAGIEIAPREEILLHLYRGLFDLQQKRLISGLRALFDANQITRKELGQKPLRGVSDDQVRAAFGDAPFHQGKRTKRKPAEPRDPGDALGDFLDDLT